MGRRERQAAQARSITTLLPTWSAVGAISRAGSTSRPAATASRSSSAALSTVELDHVALGASQARSHGRRALGARIPPVAGSAPRMRRSRSITTPPARSTTRSGRLT